MSEIGCYRCETTIDVQEDEWWQWSWEENPSKENVEKAIEDRDFRDWFRENYVLCHDCHEDLKETFGAEPTRNGGLSEDE